MNRPHEQGHHSHHQTQRIDVGGADCNACFFITGNAYFVQPFDDTDALLPVRLKTIAQRIADDPQRKGSLTH